MSIPIGINIDSIGMYPRMWFSPDIWATAGSNLNNDTKLHEITYLATPYISGSNTLTVTDPNTFSRFEWPGTCKTIGFNLIHNGQSIGFNGLYVVGDPKIEILSWSNPSADQDYPAGTPINISSYYFINYDNLPLPEEYIDASGRQTSYPHGLNNNQSIGLFIGTSNLNPTGYYTFFAKGSGGLHCAIKDQISQNVTNIYINIQSGVPSSQLIIPPYCVLNPIVSIYSSDIENPLHDIRLVMDGFEDIYLKHKDDPDFFMFHPRLIDDLKPFSVIRFLDALGTNDSYIQEWLDKPLYKGVVFGTPGTYIYYEWITKLILELNSDLWWNVPQAASDEYVYKLANFLYKELIFNSRYTGKIHIEYSNEVWNWAFNNAFYCAYMNVLDNYPDKVQYIYYTNGYVYVNKLNHGFTNNQIVQIENCDNDNLNGLFNINVIDNDNFSYPVSNINSRNVNSRDHTVIVALDPNSTASDTVKSITWDKKNSNITVKTTNPHNFGLQDIVQIANAEDPGFNQIWCVDAALDKYTFVTSLFNEPFHRAIPANTTSSGKNGNPIRVWKIAQAHGSDGPNFLSGWDNTNYYLKRSAQIHKIFHDVFDKQADRLGCIIAWQISFGATDLGFVELVNKYKNYLGGNTLPDSELSIACAAYFNASGTDSVTQIFSQYKQISHLEASGEFAYATCNNHGYNSGSTIGIFDVDPGDYCNITNINVIDTNTFSYPINNTGLPNGNPVAGTYNMVAVENPIAFREITNLSISGNLLTCESKNHGFPNQKNVFLCNSSIVGLHSSLDGQFNINLIDKDHFSVNFDNTNFYRMPTPQRLWAYDSSIIEGRLALYNPGATILPMLSGIQISASSCGVNFRCYETGYGDGATDNALNIAFPPYFDYIKQAVLSEAMGDIYTNYYMDMYNNYGVKCANHYSYMTQWNQYGFFGLMQNALEPLSSRYKALSALSNRSTTSGTLSLSGNWKLNGFTPSFCFDSGVQPYQVKMNMINNSSGNITGQSVINGKSATFYPSGDLPIGRYAVSCNAIDVKGVKMNTQILNVNYS